MNYRVGQRVRLLHEEGDGVIVRLIDKRTVEVDMGDDFPIDVDVEELIPVDSSESNFFDQAEEKAAVAEKRVRAVQQLGSSMLDLSLVIIPHESQDEVFRAILVNPEPADMLFTCYLKIGNRFQGHSAGRVNSGEFFPLFSMPRSELNQIKTFHIQSIAFVPGKGHPHLPLVKEFPWRKSHLNAPMRFLPPVKSEGWAYSLRDDKQVVDVDKIEQSEFVRVRKADQPQNRKEQVEVDLHIEELVKFPALMAASEMLRVQLEHLENSLSQALAENYASLVIIHGVGEGVLRKQVRERLKELPHVKAIENADPKKYGNGATLVTFV